MKRIALVLMVSVFVITMIGSANAFGPGGGYGFGCGPCIAGQPNPPAQLTTEQLEKYNRFQSEILPLRQKMLQLRTEVSILYSKQTPDFKTIADKQKEMVDIRTEIHKKAAEAGLSNLIGYGRGRGGCMGYGPAGGAKAGMGRMAF